MDLKDLREWLISSGYDINKPTFDLKSCVLCGTRLYNTLIKSDICALCRRKKQPPKRTVRKKRSNDGNADR